MVVGRGRQWRSSHPFIVATIAVGIFNHFFLYSFPVPILPYMLEVRIGIDPSKTQTMISYLMGVHALAALISSTPIGHLADWTSNRKRLMLLALCSELISTVVIAASKAVPLLFLGRVGQAVSGIMLWVVGSATLADTLGPKKMGTAMGIISTFISLGVAAGPLFAGVLLDTVGYWAAWATTIAIILIDFAMRLAMIENPREKAEAGKPPSDVTRPDSEQAPASSSVSTKSTDDQTPLLQCEPSSTDEQTGFRFYTYLFSQARFTAAMTVYLVNSILLISLDTTLPLHVKDKFHWGSSMAGLMFLALQGPGILLSPFFGWVRDRFGTRYPTGIAFLLIAPDLCLMSIPGSSYFPWARGNRWKAIYTTSVAILGILFSVLNGVAPIEGGQIVADTESRHPGIFGPHGGSSRVFSLTGMIWTLGALIGPLLSGYLKEAIGYAKMNLVFAVLSVGTALVSLVFLGPRESSK